jgi:two-component system, sensor histidine kinase and response regulator
MTGQRPRVLLVDDTEANLVALSAVLSVLDCELVTASSGNEALKAMLKHDFAVVLLDVQMSGMDGFEVATLARSNPATRDTPIVFVSAMHPTEANQLRGYGAGAVDFLFKPVNSEILISKVRVFIELWSSRKRLHDEIEAHKATLAEREAFNYSVSHDLRAPLRPLDGFSQALLEDYGDKLDDTGKMYLKRIRAAAQRMAQLIDDMLLLSRMTRSQMNVAQVDLAALARDVLAELQRNDPGRKVEQVVMAEAKVDGDGRLLRIALENLLRNAWKFTRHVEGARIEVGAREEPDGRVVFFVRDNGAGFDGRFAARLFQPFQRLHTEAEFEGTGIGLAIVQRIVRRHAGKVWAESEPGKGATFFFTVGPAEEMKPTVAA